VLPARWSLQRNNDFLLIEDPDKELKLWMVDVEGKDDLDAITLAWNTVAPHFARKIDDSASPPETGGWDSITKISYQVAPEESRVIVALSRAKDGIAYVVLIDGSKRGLQRRGAQLSQIIGSERPPGLEGGSYAGKRAKVLDEQMAATFDGFIEDARRKFRVPGAAVAVVQGGKVVLERGYGVRRLGGTKEVAPDTAFMIGSVTKPLTTLMMAVLVERGLFDWSTPVRDVLPAFRLADPDLTRKVDMRHSVCACTGLPRQDMEFTFQFGDVSPEKRLAELATMKPTTGFAETFQYSNALVSAGGFAAAHARWPKLTLMNAYERAMGETLFEPMGMTSTTFSFRTAIRGNHASPHGLRLDGQYEELPISYENMVISIAPAGGAWSTVRDMASYLQLELAEGRLPDGKALVSKSALDERRKPMVKIGPQSAYGLGIGVSYGAELRTFSHSGGTFGFSSLMAFWPEHDLGIVILTNAQKAQVFTSLVERKLRELVFEVRGAADSLLAYYVKRRDQQTGKALAKVTVPPEWNWIAPLLGVYENKALGTLLLRQQRNKYVADVGEWNSEVARYNDAGQSTLILFGPPAAGLKLQPEDDKRLLLDAGQQRYVFDRKDQRR